MAATAEEHSLVEDIAQLTRDTRETHKNVQAALQGKLDAAKYEEDRTKLKEEIAAETLAKAEEGFKLLRELELKVERMRRARNMRDEQTSDLEGLAEKLAKDPRESPAYKRSLAEYIRRGEKAMAFEPDKNGVGLKTLHFQNVPEGYEEKAAIATDLLAGAGFLAPPTMDRAIEKRVLELSPVEDHARVVTIGTGTYQALRRNYNADTIQTTGEREQATEIVQEDRYALLEITTHNLDVETAVTTNALEDAFMDFEAEIIADIAEDKAVQKGAWFIGGDGVKKPHGLMDTGGGNPNPLLEMNGSGGSTFTMDDVIKLTSQPKAPFLSRAVFFGSRDAITKIRLFRNDSGAGVGTGDYMWQPDNQEGQPPRLHGFRVVEFIDMDAVATNAFPLGFGDLFQAYRIVRRSGQRIIRDETTRKGDVIIWMRERLGGARWRGEAAVKLKTVA